MSILTAMTNSYLGLLKVLSNLNWKTIMIKITANTTTITIPELLNYSLSIPKEEFYVAAVIEATRKIYTGSDNKIRAIKFLHHAFETDSKYSISGYTLSLLDAKTIVEHL